MAKVNMAELMTYKEKTIPAGWYDVEIIGGEDRISKKTGVDYYRVNFKITDYKGEVDTEKFLDPIDYKLSTNVMDYDFDLQKDDSAEACARSLKKFVRAFGITPDSESELHTKDFKGLEAQMRVKIVPVDEDDYAELKEDGRVDEYEGEWKPEVAFGGFRKIR